MISCGPCLEVMNCSNYALSPKVFITCSVILCEADNSNTRCSQGCMNTTAAPAAHHHHRREAPIQTISHFISQGPVRLSRSVNLKDAASTGQPLPSYGSLGLL